MNTHYVCTGGCGGVSPAPGTCQATTCSKHGMPLSECNCHDGKHAGLVNSCASCGTLCKIDGGKGCSVEKYKPEIS